MTISDPSYLKGLFNTSKAIGDRIISSDSFFVIEGYEDTALLVKQFPHPTLSSEGEIEVPLPMGGKTWQPQQLKTAHQGAVTLLETKQSTIRKMLDDINANGGRFNATVYEGTIENPIDSYRLQDCFLVIENPDRDFESRGQLLMVTGNMFFHYFGEQA